MLAFKKILCDKIRGVVKLYELVFVWTFTLDTLSDVHMPLLAFLTLIG